MTIVTGIRIGRKHLKVRFDCEFYKEGKCTREKVFSKYHLKWDYPHCNEPNGCRFRTNFEVLEQY
jgi:hypothetical protein